MYGNPNIIWINGRPYLVIYTTGTASADDARFESRYLQAPKDDDEIIAERW
jgi:hypothetical protein